MHYIIGTSFSVRPNPQRGFRSQENSFNANVLYRLINISIKDNLLNYTFDGTDRSRVVLSFESSKMADLFIAKLRNEQIPDYATDIGKIDV